MKKLWPVLILLSIWAVVACDDDPAGVSEEDLVVVQAYLYSGEPVTDVRVTFAIPLSSSASSATPINDASVRLIREGLTYDLVPSGSDGYYQYPGDDLIVAADDVFRLEVTYQGDMASGETVVPRPPEDVNVSGDVLYVPEFGRGMNLSFDSLAVTWTNPEELFHYVVIENLDENAEAIFPDRIQRRMGGFRFVTLPTRDESYAINFRVLETLGPHRAKVYRVNEEYAGLYENRIQDSRDLNEPPTNIEGGLGVFSAFASDSVFFEVVRG